MPTVFLSHSHLDKDFVRSLSARLDAEGVDVWVDEAGIPVGGPILAKISEAISQVEYVAACLSPNSVRSEWVTKELLLAMTREIEGKRLIVLPLLLPGCRDEDIPAFLIDKCYADFRDPARYEAELQKLLLCLNPSRKPMFDMFHVIDAQAKNCLTEIARPAQRRAEVLDYLVQELTRRADPTELYWICIALGEIGGEEAKGALQRAALDKNPFVSQGARTGLEMMAQSSAQSNSGT